ncbi:hypothetical protein M9H77_03578 [Catharanthus roseus]|uniref:Uncharacterized protein n=1 Tax=Catharanthus roseus TaxID=4058 RepID=A0ACC0CBT0_CATRO|nr:hypothetical protein M9H77_03578 [Catharanthus roseus]
MRDGEDRVPRNTPVKRKAEKEAMVTGTTVPNDLALMSVVIGGVSRRHVYPAPSCRGLAPIGPCCANVLGRVEAAVSSVSDAFEEYMRRFTEQNYLVYTPPLRMLDLVNAAMGTGGSTSSNHAPTTDSEFSARDVPVRSSSIPSPSICALDTNDCPLPPPPPPPPLPLQ